MFTSTIPKRCSPPSIKSCMKSCRPAYRPVLLFLEAFCVCLNWLYMDSQKPFSDHLDAKLDSYAPLYLRSVGKKSLLNGTAVQGTSCSMYIAEHIQHERYGFASLVPRPFTHVQKNTLQKAGIFFGRAGKAWVRGYGVASWSPLTYWSADIQSHSRPELRGQICTSKETCLTCGQLCESVQLFSGCG